MTRQSLRKTLRLITVAVGLILAVALAAKLAPHIRTVLDGGTGGVDPVAVAGDLYEYARDMSLLVATIAVAWLAHALQRRATFTESLRQEWRAIVSAKSKLIAFCNKPYATTEDYHDAYACISEAIDNMRVVYRNVGETDRLIGLYPYAPLHDMRRALSTLDPAKGGKVSAEHRALVRDAIVQAFYALRENFMDELDLEQPSQPLVAAVGRRLKTPGSTRSAKRIEQSQTKRYEASSGPRPDIDTFLSDLYYREQANDLDRAKSAVTRRQAAE